MRRGRGRSPGLESLYLVTHDVDLALTHADRILLFRDGRVVADGPPSAVIEDEERWIACNLRFDIADAGERPIGVRRRDGSSTPRRSPARIVAREAHARRLERRQVGGGLRPSEGQSPMVGGIA